MVAKEVIFLSSNEKLIAKFQKEPLPREVNLDELLKYLEIFGFTVDRDRGKGSHCMVFHDKMKYPFPIPSKNGKTVSFVYLKELNKIIKNMED